MTGKDKCNLLRRVRADIARENGLCANERECTHTGECAGTCPKCEKEVKQLASALENRRALGKRVALAGVSLGLCAVLTGCASITDRIEDALDALRRPVETQGIVELAGEVDFPANPPEPEPDNATACEPDALTGMVMPEDSSVVYALEA